MSTRTHISLDHGIFILILLDRNQDALQVMFEASFPRLLGYGPNCVGDAALSLHYGFWNKDGELETGR